MDQLLKYTNKKVKASSLVEVLVASVLIVVIFAIASMSLNNIFKATVSSNTAVIENELNRLQYLYQHQKINTKYTDDFHNWGISVVKNDNQSNGAFSIQAKHVITQKIITRHLYE